MSKSYMCFRPHKASCHLIVFFSCTSPINLPYSTGKKGKALLYRFIFFLLVCLKGPTHILAVKSDFPAHWANILNKDFLFYFLLLNNDFTDTGNRKAGRSERIKDSSLGRKSSFIKYKNEVYVSGTQGCCELALGHRWQSCSRITKNITKGSKSLTWPPSLYGKWIFHFQKTVLNNISKCI